MAGKAPKAGGKGDKVQTEPKKKKKKKKRASRLGNRVTKT